MKRLFAAVVIVAVLVLGAHAWADVQTSKNFLKNVHWLGHDTFRIEAAGVIYTDPFRIKDKDAAEKADIILITHEHQDHCSSEDVRKIAKAETIIVTTPSCAPKLSGNVKIIRKGDTIEIAGVKVEAVPAYNVDKKYHPKEHDGVGYVVTIKGLRLYLAGDTDHIPEMKALKNINIAFLPVSGTSVMTAEEAVKAAFDIKPDVAVPMHYGAIIGTRLNAELFAEKLRHKIEVVIMKEE
jgi:L-ascorbate metabolism protein UlaG (beta-lactamase superfamily)